MGADASIAIKELGCSIAFYIAAFWAKVIAPRLWVKKAPNQLIEDKSKWNADVGATQRWIGRNTVG
jgi:hypothetical protein